jgi:uncharacterized protein (TIRG00374 family)
MALRTDRAKLGKLIARLLITGLALFFILRMVDLSAVLPLFARADFPYVGIAVGVSLLIRVVMAWKWKLLLHYCGAMLSLGSLLRISLVSAFIGIALPSGVGTDIIRTISVGRLTGYTSAAVSTIADRVMAVVALALWSLAAAVVALWVTPTLKHVLLPIVAICAGIIVALIMLLSDTAMRIASRLRARKKRVGSSRVHRLIAHMMNKAVLIHHELRRLFSSPTIFVSVFSFNLLFQGARIIMFYVLFLAVGVHVAIIFHIIFAPIVIFGTLLPLSFLGIGIKEATIVFFYTRVGVDPASAFAVSMWTYIVNILPLAIGGFLYLLGPSFGANEMKLAAKGSRGKEQT